jgi:hypothetical protein
MNATMNSPSPIHSWNGPVPKLTVVMCVTISVAEIRMMFDTIAIGKTDRNRTSRRQPRARQMYTYTVPKNSSEISDRSPLHTSPTMTSLPPSRQT